VNVLIAGAAPEAGGDAYYRSLLAEAPVVIGADAGAEWAASLGRIPDVAVGDFDSAQPGAVQRLRDLGVDVVTFPGEKDFSDLDLALQEALSRGATRVTFTAASSLRLDHTLAALGALVAAAPLAGALDEPSLAAWALDGVMRPRLSLDGPAGAVVSVIAVGAPAEGVTLAGFRYPLAGARLQPLSSHGLSNELSCTVASVSVVTGRLLVLSPGPPEQRARARV
jgi:thiamine pyrophosphokinase